MLRELGWTLFIHTERHCRLLWNINDNLFETLHIANPVQYRYEEV